MCFWLSSASFISFAKMLLLFHISWLKCSIYKELIHSCHAYQELGLGNIYLFHQEKMYFLESYLLPAYKINNAYLTDFKIFLMLSGGVW